MIFLLFSPNCKWDGQYSESYNLNTEIRGAKGLQEALFITVYLYKFNQFIFHNREIY